MFGHGVPRKRIVLAGAGVLLAAAIVCGAVRCAAPLEDDEAKAAAVEQAASKKLASRSVGRDAERDAKKGAKDGKEGKSTVSKPEGDGGASVERAAGNANASASKGDAAAPSADVSAPSGGASSAHGETNISGGSADNSPAQHTHNWVPQTVTVHHDAEYQYIYHPATTQGVLICNHCNVQFDSADAWAAHIDVYINEYLATNPPLEEGSLTIHIPNASYRTESVVVAPGWEEQVLVSEAWDETATVGHVCSGCGAVK